MLDLENFKQKADTIIKEVSVKDVPVSTKTSKALKKLELEKLKSLGITYKMPLK